MIKLSMRKILLRSMLLLWVACLVCSGASLAPKPYGPMPSEPQVAWAREEIIGIVHFALNTYTGTEWGYGDEDVALFNPENFDAGQIVRAAKAAGIKSLVIVAKHHGGFCLWPSAFNDHFTVKNSPWRQGRGDMLREFVDACRAENIGVGIYLSPWDRNHRDYGSQAYVDYYHSQLRELLSNYGPLTEVWFDGANGGDGYYGGFRGKKSIESESYYQWDKIMRIVRDLQPGAVCFGREDLRWVGNEDGVAGDPCWSTVREKSDVGNGDRSGKFWVPAEADFPLRKGWFWHPDDHPKSPAYLVNCYFSTVGRNAVMNIGLAPDRRGLLCDEDRASLQGLGERLRAIFKDNLARQATYSASNVRNRDPAFAAANAFDGHRSGAYWACDDAVTSASLELDFHGEQRFNIVSLREPLRLGQRIDSWALDAWSQGAWREFAKGSCIGSRRLWRGEPIVASKLRLRIIKASACPAISEVAVYLEPEASRSEAAAEPLLVR